MMKKRIIILLVLLAAICLGMQASTKKRIRGTFDQGWTFRLSANHAEASEVLRTLGIADADLSAQVAATSKTEVTDDTEPEQAQVTASEITKGQTSTPPSGKAFRNFTIPHDWSIELPFDPKMGGSDARLARQPRSCGWCKAGC